MPLLSVIVPIIIVALLVPWRGVIGTSIRVSFLGCGVYLVWLKFAAVQDFSSAGLLLLSLILWAVFGWQPWLVAIRNRYTGRLQSGRHFWHWLGTKLFTIMLIAGMLLYTFVPGGKGDTVPALQMLPLGARAALNQDEPRPGEPYEAELTSDGRFLFVTHAHTKGRGVSRIDLITGEQAFIPHHFDDAMYILMLESQNRLLVPTNEYGDENAWNWEERSTVLEYSIDPFTEVSRHEIPIRSLITAGGNRAEPVVYLAHEPELLFPETPSQPTRPPFRRLNLPPGIINLEWMDPEDDGVHAWFLGEEGYNIARVNLVEKTISREFWVGFKTWRSLVDETRNQLYVSRGMLHRVDIRDTEDGTLLDTIRVAGHPKYLLLDPDGRYLYAGLYICGKIAVIDLKQRIVTRYIETGSFQLRRLLIRETAKQRDLYAISASGVFHVPLDLVRP